MSVILIVSIVVIIMCILLLIGIALCIIDLYNLHMATKIAKKHYLTKSEKKHLIAEVNKKSSTNVFGDNYVED